jgi:hypothetical protein
VRNVNGDSGRRAALSRLPALFVLLVLPAWLCAGCAGSSGGQDGGSKNSGGNRDTGPGSGGFGGGTNGSVASFPKTATRLASGIEIDAMALSGTQVIVTNGNGVFTIPKTGAAAPTRLASDPAGDLVIAGNRIYWSRVIDRLRRGENSVMAMDLDGSNQVGLRTNAAFACGLVFARGRVFWAEPLDETIYVYDPAGGTAALPRVFADKIGEDVCALAPTSDTVYWIDRGGISLEPAGKVVALPDNAVAPTVLVQAQDRPIELLVNGNHLYWINSAIFFGEGAIKRMPITTPPMVGTPSTLASDLEDPADIAIDGGYLYWTADEGVRRVPLAGGPITSVSSIDDVHLRAIAIDDSHIYFSTYSLDVVDANALYRVAK